MLSLASFLAGTAELYPPSVPVSDPTNHKVKDNKVHHLKPTGKYLEIWCDLLFRTLEDDHIIHLHDEAVLFLEIQRSYLNHALSSGFFQEVGGALEGRNPKVTVAEYFYGVDWTPTLRDRIRRIAIINLSASVTNVDKTKPKINVNGLFSGLFYRHGDKWQTFEVLNHEIPSVNDLLCFDTIMISGSTYSVNQMHPYMKILAENIKEALSLSKSLKVIGICFGHQFISHIFGAKVEKKQLIRGPKFIQMKPHNLGNLPFLDELYDDTLNLKPYEFHSDYVVTIPDNFTSIASSHSCSNEMFISNDKRILSFQFHPEYLSEYIRFMEGRWNQ